MYANIEDLVGKAVKEASNDNGTIRFALSDGCIFKIEHQQDCCESVDIHECGDIATLVGTKINSATEHTVDGPPKKEDYHQPESETWTEYDINGIKILWYGQSNGYYSETPSCYLDETNKTVDLAEDLKPEVASLKPTASWEGQCY